MFTITHSHRQSHSPAKNTYTYTHKTACPLKITYFLMMSKKKVYFSPFASTLNLTTLIPLSLFTVPLHAVLSSSPLSTWASQPWPPKPSTPPAPATAVAVMTIWPPPCRPHHHRGISRHLGTTHHREVTIEIAPPVPAKAQAQGHHHLPPRRRRTPIQENTSSSDWTNQPCVHR